MADLEDKDLPALKRFAQLFVPATLMTGLAESRLSFHRADRQRSYLLSAENRRLSLVNLTLQLRHSINREHQRRTRTKTRCASAGRSRYTE